MKVIVTGGAGFIGSHIVEELASQNHSVAVIDNFVTGTLENLAHIQNKVTVKNFSVVSEEARNFIVEFQPELIVHLAAQMSVRKSVEDPMFDADQNILGMINILESINLAGSVNKLIFSSTGGAIYGEQDFFPADESHPITPECPYGLSKFCAERYIKYYTPLIIKSIPNFSSTALRFGNVYGPRQNPKGEAGVIAIFSRRLHLGQDLIINGDGEQTRDFIYVKDVANAVFDVVAEKQILTRDSFSVFNLGTGIETSINEISVDLKEAHKRNKPSASSEIIHREAAPGEQRRSLLDAGLFSRTYGWRPQVNIKEGLKMTLDSFAESTAD